MSTLRHARRLTHWLAVHLLLVFGFAACATHVNRAPQDGTEAESGRLNDTDSHTVAAAMVQEALDSPWLQRFTQFAGRPPMVAVGTVLNRGHERLNTHTFLKDLQRELSNSRQVQYVTDAGQRQEVRQERAEQGQNVRPDPVKPAGQDLGADFILQGSITTTVQSVEATKALHYQIDLELFDITSNVKVWSGQKTLTKIVERHKATL